MKLFFTFSLCLVYSLILTACNGRGPITRPGDYNKMIALHQDGRPTDIPKMLAANPELDKIIDGKPMVITAPEYIEEYSAIVERLKAEGKNSGPLFMTDFVIPAGMNIQIEVPADKFSRTYTIGPHGYIDIPSINKEIQVTGKTLRQLKQELVEAWSSIVKDPKVHVNAVAGSANTTNSALSAVANQNTSIYGGKIQVFGAVGGSTYSNALEFTGNETLLSAIGNIPGTAEWRHIRVIRRSQEDPLRSSRIIICDMWSYFSKGDVKQDIPLMPGDVVYIPVKFSTGDHFAKDWGLMMQYLQAPLSVDRIRSQLQTLIKQ